MSNGHFLNIKHWPRQTQFHFFKAYEQPFFNICAEVPVTHTLAWCRKHGVSFSLACWFMCQRVINALEPFRYRLRGEGVWVHDQIRIATTVLQEDETFSFCYLPFREDFISFCKEAKKVMQCAKEGLMGDQPEDDAVIHGSTLPWIRFTSIAHARRTGRGDSVPNIVFGRYGKREGETVMPISIEVHHALMDGLHASRFFEKIELEFANPSKILANSRLIL